VLIRDRLNGDRLIEIDIVMNRVGLRAKVFRLLGTSNLRCFDRLFDNWEIFKGRNIKMKNDYFWDH
jgi:hypothetical protein